MKTKYFSITILLLLLIAASSCKKDSAEIKPAQSTNSQVLTEAVPENLTSAPVPMQE